MHRNFGGNRVATAVGLGLTASFFMLGIALVGTMVVLEEVLGGVGESGAPRGRGRGHDREPSPEAGRAAA